MGKELAEIIKKNRIVYCLVEDECYYPDLRLPKGTHYNIGEYRMMRGSIYKQTVEGSISGC